MADVLTALSLWFMAEWPVLVIGAFLGVLFAWSRWVPSKWAVIKGAVTKRSMGVLKIRLRSKKFHNEIADFGKLVHRSKKGYGAYSHTKCIVGYEDGVPIAVVNQTDPDAVPAFKNDYRAEDMRNPSNFDDALEASFIAGQISQMKEDKKLLWLAAGACLFSLGAVVLIFFQVQPAIATLQNGVHDVAQLIVDKFGSVVVGKPIG